MNYAHALSVPLMLMANIVNTFKIPSIYIADTYTTISTSISTISTNHLIKPKLD